MKDTDVDLYFLMNTKRDEIVIFQHISVESGAVKHIFSPQFLLWFLLQFSQLPFICTWKEYFLTALAASSLSFFHCHCPSVCFRIQQMLQHPPPPHLHHIPPS